MGFSACSISLQTWLIVSQVGAKDLDADLRAHAGREHVDAVGDGLRPDVAPAGHLHDRVHLLHQVPLRPSLPPPEEEPSGERLFQLLAQGDEGRQGLTGRTPCRCGPGWPGRQTGRTRPRALPPLSELRTLAFRASSSSAAQVKASTPRSKSSQLIFWLILRLPRAPAGACSRRRALRRRRSCGRLRGLLCHLARRTACRRVLGRRGSMELPGRVAPFRASELGRRSLGNCLA